VSRAEFAKDMSQMLPLFTQSTAIVCPKLIMKFIFANCFADYRSKIIGLGFSFFLLNYCNTGLPNGIFASQNPYAKILVYFVVIWYDFRRSDMWYQEK
jgi:hypothetical protein